MKTFFVVHKQCQVAWLVHETNGFAAFWFTSNQTSITLFGDQKKSRPKTWRNSFVFQKFWTKNSSSFLTTFLKVSLLDQRGRPHDLKNGCSKATPAFSWKMALSTRSAKCTRRRSKNCISMDSPRVWSRDVSVIRSREVFVILKKITNTHSS